MHRNTSNMTCVCTCCSWNDSCMHMHHVHVRHFGGFAPSKHISLDVARPFSPSGNQLPCSPCKLHTMALELFVHSLQHLPGTRKRSFLGSNRPAEDYAENRRGFVAQGLIRIPDLGLRVLDFRFRVLALGV